MFGKSKKNGGTGNADEIFNIPPYLIKPNPSLSRTDFPDTSLISLADSIRRYGILQPLAVRMSENGKYELIAGERRLRAATLLKLPTVPCVMPSKGRDHEYLSAVENLQREKLNMFDEARALRRLCAYTGNISDTAKLLSMGEQELVRKIRLADFTRAEMQAIITLGMSENTAIQLLALSGNIRYYAIKACAEKRLSAEQVSQLCAACGSKAIASVEELEKEMDIITGKETDSEKKDADSRTKILLRDLRTFEVTLEKSCRVLEKAGFSVTCSTDCSEGRTVYNICVEDKRKSAEELKA